MTFCLFGQFSMAILVLVLAQFSSLTSGQSADMSRYSLLIESDSQDELKYQEINAIFMFDSDVGIFTKIDKELAAVLFYNNKNRNFNAEPIYNLQFHDKPGESYHLSLQIQKHQQLFDDYLNKYTMVSACLIDFTLMILVFDGGNGTKSDIVVPYIYRKHKSRKNKLFDKGEITKGTVPLIHQDTKLFDFVNTKVPATLINNRQYTYQTAWFQFEPVSFRIVQTYYIGFNKKLDQIYFGKKFEHIEKIPDFLHPKFVIGVERWHPFRCYDYIYLAVTDWIFMFPHLNLTNTDNDDALVMSASMTVMHRNAFLRNPNSKLVNIPAYPDRTIVDYSKDAKNPYHWLKPSDTTSKMELKQDLSSNQFLIIFVLAVVFVLGAAVVGIGIVQNRRQLKDHGQHHGQHHHRNQTKSSKHSKKSKKLKKSKKTPSAKRKKFPKSSSSSSSTTMSEMSMTYPSSKFQPIKINQKSDLGKVDSGSGIQSQLESDKSNIDLGGGEGNASQIQSQIGSEKIESNQSQIGPGHV